jgi:hypothetical protein
VCQDNALQILKDVGSFSPVIRSTGQNILTLLGIASSMAFQTDNQSNISRGPETPKHSFNVFRVPILRYLPTGMMLFNIPSAADCYSVKIDEYLRR